LKLNKDFSFEQQEQSFNMPTMVVLMARDNSKNYASTDYKNIIFDTSNEKILSRCQQTLDWCCPTGFQKIDHAYLLTETLNIRESKRKNKRENGNVNEHPYIHDYLYS